MGNPEADLEAQKAERACPMEKPKALGLNAQKADRRACLIGGLV
jgi:hypothetical protein